VSETWLAVGPANGQENRAEPSGANRGNAISNDTKGSTNGVQHRRTTRRPYPSGAELRLEAPSARFYHPSPPSSSSSLPKYPDTSWTFQKLVCFVCISVEWISNQVADNRFRFCLRPPTTTRTLVCSRVDVSILPVLRSFDGCVAASSSTCKFIKLLQDQEVEKWFCDPKWFFMIPQDKLYTKWLCA
jgi:hypothetical protein